MSHTANQQKPPSAHEGESWSGSSDCYPSIDVFGMSLPVIADLPDGHKLALHKNGPCIATEHSLWALELAAGEPPPDSLFDERDDEEDHDLPYEVRRAALTKYVEWSWPRVRATVFDG